MNICRTRGRALQTTPYNLRGRTHRRWFDTHSRHIEMLSPQDLRITYPELSKHLNEQHFYQVGIRKWVERPPRPLTLSQMAQYGRHMSKQKVIQSANHVAEELTIRFAHRIRQMQATPYRLMGHPALLDTYEQYIDSFELLRRIGPIRTLEDNEKLLETGQKLLEKHTLVVTNVIRGVREIVNGRGHKEGDAETLNQLVKSMLTSRLSRRVLVKQHVALCDAWKSGYQLGEQKGRLVGDIKLDCRVIDVLRVVESRAKANLSRVFNVEPGDMPAIVLEGDPNDSAATFPYLWQHFEFVFGELIYNSLEACLNSKVKEPIIVTVSATPDSVMIRISDQGGGLSDEKLEEAWSFTHPDIQVPLTPRGLADHQFFSLLFPADELTQVIADTDPELLKQEPEPIHLGLGLALSRLYVEYWGGALELHPIEGFGCDVLLRLSRNGTKQENLRLTV